MPTSERCWPTPQEICSKRVKNGAICLLSFPLVSEWHCGSRDARYTTYYMYMYSGTSDKGHSVINCKDTVQKKLCIKDRFCYPKRLFSYTFGIFSISKKRTLPY